MKYPLAIDTWGPQERKAIDRVIQSGRTTMGPETEAYEEEFAAYFGSKYAVAVNSGSSANLLMVAAQMFRPLPNGLYRGDEVIVPTMGWATTYAPLQQYGLKLRFVDVRYTTLCMNGQLAKLAITEKTAAVLVVNLLGNTADLSALREFCEANAMTLLEDNCEAMGADHLGNYAGTFGNCGSFSTFFSHHISTMEGGVVVTDDAETYHILLSLRSHGWTRGQPEGSRYHRDDPDAWEFVLPGYNVRPLEVSSAVGREQLKKLPKLLAHRRKNHDHFVEAFCEVPFAKPLLGSIGSSHFGLVLMLNGKLSTERDALRKYLAENGVESRTVVSGNFLRHPVAKMYDTWTTPYGTSVADEAHDFGIMLGNHGCDMRKGITHARDVVAKFLKEMK